MSNVILVTYKKKTKILLIKKTRKNCNNRFTSDVYEKKKIKLHYILYKNLIIIKIISYI